jgi:hypothetical protein
MLPDIKKIDMLPEIKHPSGEFYSHNKSSISVKRVPPKILHSIIKSGNMELIRNIRKAFE